MSTPNCKTNITGKDGGEAWIEGDPRTIALVERALAYAGARWNRHRECWDFGFYDTTPLGRNVNNCARTHSESWASTTQVVRDATHLPLKHAVEEAEAHLKEIA